MDNTLGVHTAQILQKMYFENVLRIKGHNLTNNASIVIGIGIPCIYRRRAIEYLCQVTVEQLLCLRNCNLKKETLNLY